MMSARNTATPRKDELEVPPTPSEIKSHIDPCSRTKSNARAFSILGLVTSLYFVSLAGCPIPIWWVQLIAIPVNGLAIGM